MRLTFSTILVLSFVMCKAQSASEIIDNYINAIGGQDNWQSIKTIKITGKLTAPQGDMGIVIYRQHPNNYRMELNVGGSLIVPQAYDGNSAWQYNPFHGATSAQKFNERQSRNVIGNATFENAFIDYKKKGHSIELVGKEMVEGAECYKIILLKKDNLSNTTRVEYHYFDTENFIRIKSVTFGEKGINADSKNITLYSDFQEVNGKVIVPFYKETTVHNMPSGGHGGHGGQSRTISQKLVIDTFEINTELNPELFKFPEES